ncbi:B12-binding domain-containing radical SAM protein [Desulfatirhabdium butyrativorans]|uniref:B12-binding domain-containing radical SAM protein n=1 Tax=Desulfatirhabdium butyrativorans TaxID=340467 RepID=UPI0004134F3A|nr:radical SAM protein [Desulfatirhabdium butyrativorans]
MLNRRLLLIQPPFYRLYQDRYALVRYPLGIGYLAASVRERTDWDVLAYNADFLPASDPFEVRCFQGAGFARYRAALADRSHALWNEVRDTISAYRPAVVGISSKSTAWRSTMAVAQIAKECDSETVVLVGGPHPSSVFTGVPGGASQPDESCRPGIGEVDKLPGSIDIAAIGEGEDTLVELLHFLERGKHLDSIRGIVFRKGSRLFETGHREPIAHLDALPFPFRYAASVLKDYERYPAAAFGHLFATRGCPYHCLFCGSRNVWGRQVRFRSPRNVIEEMSLLRDAGLDHLHFDDDTFGVNGAYLRALCQTIAAHGPDIGWSCEMHVHLISDENLRIMKQAGCVMIQLGIESGNNEILRSIRKGFTIEQALDACRKIRNHGMALQTFFMAGFPEETETTISDTARIIESIDCDKIIYSIFTPYPGTEAFTLCRDMGIIGNDGYDPSRYSHQSPENCFCRGMDKERFREISGRIEAVVMQKNRTRRIQNG